MFRTAQAYFALVLLCVASGCGPGTNLTTQGEGTGGRSLVGARDTLTVLTLNLAHGRDHALNQVLVSAATTRQNLDDVADVLERVDAEVVAFQEADAPSRWSGNFNHVQYLADASGYEYVVHGHHAESALFKYGTALMSRYELTNMQSQPFDPSPPTLTKGFVSATVFIGANAVPVTVVSVHLDFSRQSVRDAQIGALVDASRSWHDTRILMGDLNSEWHQKDSHVRKLAELLDLKAFDPDSDQLGTYKSTAGARLDWILISNNLEFVDYRVLPDKLSDHFALFATVRYFVEQS